MSDNEIEPRGNPEPDRNAGDPPMDDSGIDNDHILDLCDWTITSLWVKFSSMTSEERINTSISEYKELADTLQSVWTLTLDIIALDGALRMKEDDEDDQFDDYPENF